MILGVGIGPYVDIPSMLIVFGGSIGALFISFRLDQMKNMPKFFMIAFKPPKQDIPGMIKKLIGFAMTARKEGLLSLENVLKNEENRFLKMA